MALVFRSIDTQESEPAQNGQRMAVYRCEHASVLIGDEVNPVRREDIPEAEPVVFGKDGEGVLGVANRAFEQMYLGQRGLADVSRMAVIAEEHGMPLLMRLGDSQSYVVYHVGHRSIDASWAVVASEMTSAPTGRGGGGGDHSTLSSSMELLLFFCDLDRV